MSMLPRLPFAFAAVVAFAPLSSASAQQTVDVVARVPFAFTVGSSSLPRDTYELSRLNGHSEMLLVRGERNGVVIRSQEIRGSEWNGTPSLVFHRYGDQYFLREIRLEGRSQLDLPETAAERDAAERRADRAASHMEKIIVSGEQR
jgi:hypothetical protein